MPSLLSPSKDRYDPNDCEKVFCPDPEPGTIFALSGIRRPAGCSVVMRPDRHVTPGLRSGARAELAALFDRSRR